MLLFGISWRELRSASASGWLLLLSPQTDGACIQAICILPLPPRHHPDQELIYQNAPTPWKCSDVLEELGWVVVQPWLCLCEKWEGWTPLFIEKMTRQNSKFKKKEGQAGLLAAACLHHCCSAACLHSCWLLHRHCMPASLLATGSNFLHLFYIESKYIYIETFTE